MSRELKQTEGRYTLSSVDDLIPYVSNARTHSAEQVAKIAASIKEFGFINPVIIDGENGIIAGHGRVMAAKKLGLKQVPALLVDHLTDAQRRAYILADNRLAEDAGWDDEMLKVELAGLLDEGFDVALTGFSSDELSDGAPLTPEDGGVQEIAEVLEIAVTCDDEHQQQELFERFQKEGLRCRLLNL